MFLIFKGLIHSLDILKNKEMKTLDILAPEIFDCEKP